MAIRNEQPGLNRRSAARNNFTGALGHGFVPSVDVWVTQLGRYFVGSSSNHAVRIWQHGVTGAAIVSGTILATSTADSAGYKWVTIPTTKLTAGTRYYVVAEEVNGGDGWADLFDLSQETDPPITFWGYALTNTGVNGSYPALQQAGINGYNTATFKYDTVDPGAAAGSLQLNGTLISGGTDAGSAMANVTDGSFTTHWLSSSANTGWIGVDAGANAVVTKLLFAPRPGDASNDYELRVEGSKVQASAASDFTGAVDLDTLPTRPTLPFAPRYQFTERTITTSGAGYRYYRLFNDGTGKYGGNFSEVRWIANAGTITDARPVKPTISPHGGRYPTARCQVTLSCATTNAYIIYTTDGSTPNYENGTVYTGPFWIQWTGKTKTVKAIAYQGTLDANGSEVASAVFSDAGFQPRDDWRDDRGVLVEAHSGHILDNRARDGRFYWYGTSMNSATNAFDNRLAMGIMCYSSTDLMNWRWEGNILPQPTGFFLNVRCHVLHCPNTNKFVLWTHAYNNPPGATDRAAVAQSDHPASGWGWVNQALNPDGFGYKDSCLFQDENGDGYVIYTRGDQNGMVVSKLADDYLTTAGQQYVEALSGGVDESPAMLKRNGVYFLISGSANAYYSEGQSFTTKYQTATNPLGTWSATSLLHHADPVGTNYNAQITQVLQLPEYEDGYVFIGDFWIRDDLYNSRQVWMPLFFPTSTTMQVGQPTDWTLDGTFSRVLPSARRFLFLEVSRR